MINDFGSGLTAALLMAGVAAFGTPHGRIGVARAAKPSGGSLLLISDASAQRNSKSSIGWAHMTSTHTIQLHLRATAAPVSQWGAEPIVPPQEMVGYGDIELLPGDQHYDTLLRHIGGLKPGETKLVPVWQPGETWHCALDPHRGPCPIQYPLLRSI